MPEGPEIHREADKIRTAICGKEIKYAYFYHDHLKNFEKDLVSLKVESVEAKGKAMLIGFEKDFRMFSHNQLYGKWFIKNAGEYPNTNRQLRAELQTNQKSALLYSASDIDIMDTESLLEHPYLEKIGPDILSEITPQQIAARAKSEKFSGRSFAALLLDQQFLSGVGNYLRSEILFDACIHPDVRPKDLNDEKLLQLGQSAITISQRSYHTGGITLNDHILKNAKKNGEKRKKTRFYVFSRAGKLCRICENPIQKIQKSGRRLYICKQCQGE